jgi:hypothetical protein
MKKPMESRVEVVGSKYADGQDVAAIARGLRDDIKAAVAAGALPRGFKASVRSERFSLGRAVRVEVTACPGVPIHSPARARQDLLEVLQGGCFERKAPYLAPEGREVLEAVEALVGAYNRTSERRGWDDHSERSFWVDVSFASELTTASRLEAEQAARQALAPAPAPASPPLLWLAREAPANDTRAPAAVCLDGFPQ